MKNPQIYTLSCCRVSNKTFSTLLRTHSINCVVDLRSKGRSLYDYGYTQEQTEATVKGLGVYYLPFGKHFDAFLGEERDRNGYLIYEKVCKTDVFKEGIERICNGIKKGYRIMLLDNSDAANIERSLRFGFAGRALFELGYEVVHIDHRLHTISHQDLINTIEAGKQAHKRKKDEAKRLGTNGEELAALYLINNGYSILDRNWNLYKGCELDIIAKKDNKLHFVEVKTRSSRLHGDPEEAIDRMKMKHIVTAIREYMWNKYITDMKYQIDYIAIIYRSEDDFELKHRENIAHAYTTTY